MINVPQEIKDILHQDTCQKNIRIHFPNGERTDICNDLIVMNSVNLKESLCSQNTFKFGLVESPIFECEVVGVSNITGAKVEITCEVFCPFTVQGAIWQADIQEFVYPIKYGTFVVHSAERQSDILHRKLICYNIIVKDTGFALNKYECCKGNIYMGLPEISEYKPNIFYLFCSQVDGDVTFFGNQMSSENLIIEDYADYEETYEGTYYGEPAQWKISLHYDCISFGPQDDEYNNPTDYPAKIVFDSNKKYYKEFMDYINDRNHLIPGALALNNNIRETRHIFTNGITILSEEFDVSDFCFYPYINDYTHKIGIQILAKIEFFLNGSEQVYHRIKVAYPHYGLSKYYYTNLDSLQALTYPIPIEYDTDTGDRRINYSDFNLQEVMNAYLEVLGAFGYLNRDGGFDVIDIKQKFGLLPSGSLYPSNTLYPQGVTGGSILPQDYESCWYGDAYRKPYGRIVINYVHIETIDDKPQKVNKILDKRFLTYTHKDEDTFLTYVMDNVVLRNVSISDSLALAIWFNYMNSLSHFSYMPLKLVGRGLPYIEVGDTYEVLTPANDSITTIVLSRTLKGEMVLQDEYTSVS